MQDYSLAVMVPWPTIADGRRPVGLQFALRSLSVARKRTLLHLDGVIAYHRSVSPIVTSHTRLLEPKCRVTWGFVFSALPQQ